MLTQSSQQVDNVLSRQMVVRFFVASNLYLRRLGFGSWLRMALVFTILTGGLLVAFFGITVRVEAATGTRFTPAAPPTSRLPPRAIPRNPTRR